MELVYASITAARRPLFEKLGAVAGAGFDGISVWTGDYRDARAEGHSDADIVAAVRDSGVEIASVGGATRWLSGAADEDEEQAVDLARRFGSSTINCSPTNGRFRGLAEAASAFAAVCDRAARHGLRCRLEFVPWSGIADLTTASNIIRLADRRNGGLLVDNWHLHRSGGVPVELRGVPPEWIFGVQLSDARRDSGEQGLRADAFHRLLPGDGDLDVAGFVRVIEQIGAAVAYEAEPINPRWDQMTASQSMPVVREAMARVITAARLPLPAAAETDAWPLS